MSELHEAIERLGGLPLKRYCQITGETPNTVYQRKLKKVWLVGRELYRPEGADWWVDLVAVSAWFKASPDVLVDAVANRVLKGD